MKDTSHTGTRNTELMGPRAELRYCFFLLADTIEVPGIYSRTSIFSVRPAIQYAVGQLETKKEGEMWGQENSDFV